MPPVTKLPSERCVTVKGITVNIRKESHDNEYF
jgi:hypothetical protein